VTRSARVLRKLIRGYQVLSANRPPTCRFHPSCSTYAMEAIERHGAARGSWLAARRLARCQPFGGYGVDPVPD
jgi:putative membrane protein insertion efficiency factor